MNANELADELETGLNEGARVDPKRIQAAAMLRQLQAEIEALKAHPVKEQDGCGNCHACLVGVIKHGLPITSQRMILCPDCGNKRCPKASNHRHQCTNSNEPNQRGSIYSHPAKELTDEEIMELAEKHLCAFTQFGCCNANVEGEIEFAKAILRKAQ